MSTHIVKFYTDKQLEVEKWINDLGFRTQLEVSFGKYCVDIYIPELNWVIEIDGFGHWKKRDEKRDKILYSIGIEMVLHIPIDTNKEEFNKIFKECIEKKYGNSSFEKRFEENT